MQVVSDMLDIKVRIQQWIGAPMEEMFVQERLMFA
jgi:hypothetical protein